MISVAMSISPSDQEVFWPEAFQSLFCQTVKPAEIVCFIDGALSEKQGQLLKKLLTPTVKVLKSDSPKGLGFALNQAVQFCTNEYIARFDSDDVCVESRFESQIEFISKNQDIDILGTNAEELLENGHLGKIRIMPESNKDIRKKIWKCPIIHPSVMYKRSKILAVGNYNINLKRRQDYDLWFRCYITKLVFHNLQKIGIRYRIKKPRKKTYMQALDQAKIGVKYCIQEKMGIIPVIGCLFPLVATVLPDSGIVRSFRNRLRY